MAGIAFWHGIVNRKNELLAVEESYDIAHAVATNLEIDSKRPTNKVVQITILFGMTLEDYVVRAAETAQAIAEERRKQRLAEKSKANFKARE